MPNHDENFERIFNLLLPMQVDIQKLNGKIDVVETKLLELAKSSELTTLKMDLKEHIGKQIKLHEKEKHSNNEIKIRLPLKLAGGGIFVGGGGALMYHLLQWWFGK